VSAPGSPAVVSFPARAGPLLRLVTAASVPPRHLDNFEQRAEHLRHQSDPRITLSEDRSIAARPSLAPRDPAMAHHEVADRLPWVDFSLLGHASRRVLTGFWASLLLSDPSRGSVTRGTCGLVEENPTLLHQPGGIRQCAPSPGRTCRPRSRAASLRRGQPAGRWWPEDRNPDRRREEAPGRGGRSTSEATASCQPEARQRNAGNEDGQESFVFETAVDQMVPPWSGRNSSVWTCQPRCRANDDAPTIYLPCLPGRPGISGDERADPEGSAQVIGAQRDRRGPAGTTPA
jgi:hypothetical protein